MNKTVFYNHLVQVTNEVYPLTCNMVTNVLPQPIKYLVKIYVPLPDSGEENSFAELNKRTSTSPPMSAKEVVEFLWKNSAVPIWVNAQVKDYDEHFTYILLECSGQFSKQETDLYHQADGYPPFRWLSPSLPDELLDENDELTGKFDLRWNSK